MRSVGKKTSDKDDLPWREFRVKIREETAQEMESVIEGGEWTYGNHTEFFRDAVRRRLEDIRS